MLLLIKKTLMKTVQTKSGNFVLVSENEYEMPISRPYRNNCSLARREEKKASYEKIGLHKYYEDNFKEGMFEGYDYGHDLGIKDPFAQEILNSGVLNL